MVLSAFAAIKCMLMHRAERSRLRRGREEGEHRGQPTCPDASERGVEGGKGLNYASLPSSEELEVDGARHVASEDDGGVQRRETSGDGPDRTPQGTRHLARGRLDVLEPTEATTVVVEGQDASSRVERVCWHGRLSGESWDSAEEPQVWQVTPLAGVSVTFQKYTYFLFRNLVEKGRHAARYGSCPFRLEFNPNALAELGSLRISRCPLTSRCSLNARKGRRSVSLPEK